MRCKTVRVIQVNEGAQPGEASRSSPLTFGRRGQRSDNRCGLLQRGEDNWLLHDPDPGNVRLDQARGEDV